MDGESAGLNLHTREVNREPLDGRLASSTVMQKKTKVISHNFRRILCVLCFVEFSNLLSESGS